MWRDPMDELIADLEQVAPPEQSKFGGNPEGTSRRCRSGPPVSAGVQRTPIPTTSTRTTRRSSGRSGNWAEP